MLVGSLFSDADAETHARDMSGPLSHLLIKERFLQSDRQTACVHHATALKLPPRQEARDSCPDVRCPIHFSGFCVLRQSLSGFPLLHTKWCVGRGALNASIPGL